LEILSLFLFIVCTAHAAKSSATPRGHRGLVKLIVVVVGFNYDMLETKVAETARSSANRIREKVKQTLDDIIGVGNELLAINEGLKHGQFGAWLKPEFGWGERMAQNFMSVAERFGSNPQLIADLTIQPTAAYLLAAPSVPEEAREIAIERAEPGEQTALEMLIVVELNEVIDHMIWQILHCVWR